MLKDDFFYNYIYKKCATGLFIKEFEFVMCTYRIFHIIYEMALFVVWPGFKFFKEFQNLCWRQVSKLGIYRVIFGYEFNSTVWYPFSRGKTIYNCRGKCIKNSLKQTIFNRNLIVFSYLLQCRYHSSTTFLHVVSHKIGKCYPIFWR